MKKRLLGVFLCIALLMTVLPFSSLAAGSDANGISNPDPVTEDNLYLSKELSQGANGTYDINMESYATGKVKSVTEKVPTDFVVVVDQSGSMDTKDMPTGDPQVRNNVNLETIAGSTTGYYYKDGDNYYRVYGVKDYLYHYYPANTWYVGDIINRVGADLSWFQGSTEQSFNYDNQFYWKEGNEYRPIKLTIAGKLGTYYNKFSYVNGAGQTVTFDRDNTQYGKIVYKNILGEFGWGPTIEDDEWGYGAIDDVVRGVYRDKNAYTYSEVNALWGAIHINTGMLVNYPMYDRKVGYTKLCYRDINGVEHEVPSNQNGRTTWEYCQVSNGEVQAITTYDGSTRPTYSGLYTYNDHVDRVTALKGALNEFAEAVAKETDDFGKVDNRISIVGFSSPGYNNTELLTHTERDISGGSWLSSGSDGWQKSTCDNNASEYYGKALVAPTDGNVGTVNPKIENAIKAITANGGTQPEDGLNMAYQILTNRGSDTTYTIRSGAKKGQSVERNTVVIFFTDGQPGDYPYSDQYSEANEVVEEAKKIKDYKDTSLFSIGVFGESDGNPLTYDARNDWTTNNKGERVRVSSIDQKNWEYLGGWMENYTSGGTTYCLRRQWRPANSDYTEKPNDTIFDYMSVVSSNYPDADDYIAPKWLDNTFSGNYIDATEGVRHIDSAEATNKYYRMASNQATLVAAFLAAVKMSNDESYTDSALGASAIFKDKVNLADFDITGATYTVKWQPAKLSGNSVVNDGTAEMKENGSPVPQNGEINYSGFDYSGNFIADGHDGQKLIITINGIKPKRLGTLTSNDGNASVYDPDKEEDVVNITSPTLDTTKKWFAVHQAIVNSNGTIGDGETKLYNIDDYSSKKFNTVAVAKNANYLYGGTYDNFDKQSGLSGEHAFTGKEDGLAFTPSANNTYHVKCVDTCYLQPRSVKLYYGYNEDGSRKIISTYGMTVTDDNKYREVGFLYNGNEIKSKDDKLYSSVTFKNVNEGSPYTPAYILASGNLVNGTATEDACLAVALLAGQATGTVQPYWVTPDGVRVTGDVVRNMKSGSKDGKDVPGRALDPTSDTEFTYQDNGMKVDTIFVGYEDEEEPADPGVKLAGYTTSLNGNIAMNFYMDLSDEVAADKDATMQFTLPGANHTEEVVKLADAKKQIRGGKTYYVFSAGVAAKDMTSEIKAQFVKGDGTKSEVWTYTIKEYCDYVRSHPDSYDAESVALVEAMLNYGGYTQEYFKHNTDKLANADLELALPEANLDESFDPVVSGECTGLTYQGTSSMLTTTTGLKHYFAIDGDASDYTFKVNGKELQLQSDKNGTYVHVDNIKAKDLSKPAALTVTNKDGSTFTLKYSVYTNVKQVVASENFTTAAKNMMKALYGYGEAAMAYFATRN